MITLNAGVMDAVFPQYDMMAVTIATGRNSLKFAAVFSDAARLLRSRIIFGDQWHYTDDKMHVQEETVL